MTASLFVIFVSVILTQARFFVPLKIGSFAMISHRSPVFYSAYVRPTVGSRLQEKGKVWQ